MYIQSTRSKSVSFSTFFKAIIFQYLSPQHGFIQKLKDRFGSNVQLYLNTEVALTMLIKFLPGRVPGMYVAVEERYVKRFKKSIERLGLKLVSFTGQKQLVDVVESAHVLAVIAPDSYGASHSRYKKRFDASQPYKIVYQNRRRPKSIDMSHDMYMWEPKSLPRSASGCVVVCAGDRLQKTASQMKLEYAKKSRMSGHEFMRELWRALRSYENRYRRIDRRPPRIMARLLYDIYNDHE